MKTILVTEIGQLLPYEDSYNTLLRHVGGIEGFYYSLDCIRASIETFRAYGASMFYILVLEGEQIRAVLPFQRIVDGPFGLRRSVQFWGALNIFATNTHRSLLVDGYRPDAIDAAMKFMCTDLRPMWDTITFKWLKTNDENLNYFTSRFPQAKTSARDDRFYFFNADTDLAGHVGAKKLREIRRYRRRLEEDFGAVEVEIKEQISPSDLEEIRQIHTGRQEGKAVDRAFFQRPLENVYVNELFNLWNRKKIVHYYSLRVNHHLAAIWILFQPNDVSYGFLIAFDNAFKKYSPSRILTHETFLHEVDRFRAKRIDTGWGTHMLKKDYSTDTLQLYDMHALNRRLRSRAVVTAIDLIFRLRQRCGLLDAMIKDLKRA